MFREVHNVWFLPTIADVTHEVAHWRPPGRSVPIAGHMAHAVLSEDLLLAGFVSGSTPLLKSTHPETGISDLMPLQGPWDSWARAVEVDLPVFLSYAQAVFANTEAYVAGVSSAQLGTDTDLSSIGFGVMSAGAFLLTLAAHVAVHAGEISNIKGLQDKQGYPF